jgi:predicted dithiol-disulfide oxidoreductase (DUF899 family)
MKPEVKTYPCDLPGWKFYVDQHYVYADKKGERVLAQIFIERSAGLAYKVETGVGGAPAEAMFRALALADSGTLRGEAIIAEEGRL